MKKLLTLSLILGLFAGCAEDRPVERVPDPNNERFLIKHFSGQKTASDELDDKDSLVALGDRKIPGKVWLSKVTVVKTSSNGGMSFTGYQSEVKAGVFQFEKNELRYVNANSIHSNDPSVEPELINSWPIEYSEYRLAESDGKPTNVEQENPYLPWNQKRYFKINWEAAKVSEATSFPYSLDSAMSSGCWSKVSSRLEDGSQEVSDDYISFTVAVDYQVNTTCVSNIRRGIRSDFTFTAHYKYSFKKMEASDYQPITYENEFDSLMKKYGYFQTYLEKKGEVWDKKIVILMNRWHPKKQHAFYFAQDFPDDKKWIFNDPHRGIFAKTNKLFKKHGLNNYNQKANTCTEGLCFEIKENDGSKKFGDIRYSFVKWTDEVQPGSPLGYGPSDANPFTGEIIAANLMLWSGDLEYYAKRLEGYIGFKESGVEKSALYKQMERTLNEADRKKWLETSDRIYGDKKSYNLFLDALPEFTYGYPYWAPFTTHGRSADGESGSLFARERDASLLSFESIERVLPYVEEKFPKGRDQIRGYMESANLHLQYHSQGNGHQRNTTLYPMDPHLADVKRQLLDGVSVEKVLDTIMYRVAIHEFGHNLNLRHNFYGSVDKRNFREKIQVEKEDKDGNKYTEEHDQMTSSVMEYLSLQDEIHLEEEWEPYDEAALVYAYSDGKIDLSEKNKTQFLYCTDEHRILNALCNTWDRGTTPTEVILSLIESYEYIYDVLNQRFDRPYWDTRGYEARVFEIMFSMKKFLALAESGMRPTILRNETLKRGHSQFDSEEILRNINRDMRQAMKLSLAFYDAVLQQPSSAKHWRTEVDPWTGSVLRVGTAADKFWAMFFLMGDDSFAYHPNHYNPYMSFLSYLNDAEMGELIDSVMENLFTQRVEMEDWFTGFGRGLFADNATSFEVMDNAQIVDSFRVACYTRESLKQNLGIDAMNLNGERLRQAIVNLDHKVKDPYFNGMGAKIGVVEYNSRYYVAHETENRYAYKIIDKLINTDLKFESALAPRKYDLYESYKLYWQFKQGRVPECL